MNTKFLFPILFFLFSLASKSLNSQNPANDFVWLFGKRNIDSSNYLGGTILNFSNNTVNVSFIDILLNFQASTMISDSTGDLQFYSNLCEISNSQHEIMQNGNQINPGFTHDGYCIDGGYPMNEGGISIPFPSIINQYIMFHLAYGDPGELDRIYYSVVQGIEDGSSGKVLQKNILIKKDSLAGQITPVKHANGRDWWVIVPQYHSNGYYIFMVSPNGISTLKFRNYGDAWNIRYWSGQSFFSPDGSRYIRTNPYNGINIFDFDRCEGEFTGYQRITLADTTFSTSGGAISPNGRFLYISATDTLHQFDLQATNIAASQKTAAVYDGFQGPFSTIFFKQRLAPNGKIYINSPSSSRYLHVIHYPDKPVPDCMVQQRGLSLATYNFVSMPNFPHFRVGPIDGSICDSLGIDNQPQAYFRADLDTMGYTCEFSNLSTYQPTDWHWDFGDGQFSTAYSPVHTYNQPGQYTVCLMISNAFGVDTFCQVIFVGITGSKEVESESLIEVLPNPFHDQIYVNATVEGTKTTFFLYNALGQLCLKSDLTAGINVIEVPLILPIGTYMYACVRGGRAVKRGVLVRQ
jgi:PKD repeat protein